MSANLNTNVCVRVNQLLHTKLFSQVSMKVRNPYVDPLNVLQAEIMKRLRKGTASDATTSDIAKEQRITLEDALIVSVNGIAQGMKNSG